MLNSYSVGIAKVQTKSERQFFTEYFNDGNFLSVL